MPPPSRHESIVCGRLQWSQEGLNERRWWKTPENSNGWSLDPKNSFFFSDPRYIKTQCYLKRKNIKIFLMSLFHCVLLVTSRKKKVCSSQLISSHCVFLTTTWTPMERIDGDRHSH